MGWYDVTIGGKPADVFEPACSSRSDGANVDGAESGDVVLFLHGHGQVTLRDNPAYTSQLERYRLRCLCPHGKRSWWGDRVCREFDEHVSPSDYLLESILPWLSDKWGTAPPRIALLGVSMGGQGALRLSYRFPQVFPIVAALAPAVDLQIWHGRGLPLDDLYPTAEAARQDSATLLLHPLNWPRHQLLMCDPTDAEWLEGTERLASKLSSTGIPFEYDFKTSHGGHTWTYLNHVAPRAMYFLHESLEQERRRLPTVGIEASR